MGNQTQSRYDRQMGLLNQRQVEDLYVVVEGSGSPLTFLLVNLVLLGVGRTHGAIFLNPRQDVVREENVTGQFLFHAKDIGQDMASVLCQRLSDMNPDARVYSEAPHDSAHCVRLIVPAPEQLLTVDDSTLRAGVWGQIAESSVFVGSKPLLGIPQFQPNILTTSLSSLCGALVAQELLLRTGCVRRLTVAKSWVSVNYHLRGRGIGKRLKNREFLAPPLTFRLADGRRLRAVPSEILDSDEVIYRVPLPDTDSASHLIADSITVIEDSVPAHRSDHSLLWSPLYDVSADGQVLEGDRGFNKKAIENKSVFVAGVGALGSWLTMLLSTSGVSNCCLTVVDMDGEVEEHNLNRQVLFGHNHVGSPKVYAAAEKLRSLNPTNRIQPIHGVITREVIACLKNHNVEDYKAFSRSSKALPTISVGNELVAVQPDHARVLAGELSSADVIVSCLDNLATRYVLNVVAETAQIPLINAAAEELQGRVERVDCRHKDPCLVCRLGAKVKTDQTRASCSTDEGDVPIQSMVTTAAITASVETILVLLSLCEGTTPAFNWLSFDGRDNTIRHVLSQPRLDSECPEHLLHDV